MADENPCSNFINDMQANLDKLNGLVKAPAVLIHHMDRLASKLNQNIMDDFNTNIMAKLNGVIDGLPNMAPSITDAISGLNKLKNCAALVPGTGNILGHTLDVGISVLNKCSEFANAPAFVKSLLSKYIIDSAMAQYNSFLNNNVFGQIAKLSNAYSNFIATSGIASALSKMQGLIQCVSDGCSAYSDIQDAASEFTDKINTFQDKFKLDDNFTISGAADKVITSVEGKTKEFIAEKTTLVEKQITTIKTFNWGLN